jgi:molybdate transport system substrate-binding protein
MKHLVTLLLGLLVVALSTGCGKAEAPVGKAPPIGGTIRVFAASSLTGSFTELGREFERQHPGTTVQLNFGASSDLATQIINGAPADVFASASPTNMRQAVQAGDARHPRAFAVNTMEIAVPPGDPGGVHRLSDLARPDVKVAVCQPQVPCGSVAAQVFDHAGITVHPVTEEVDVKSVLTKVAVGEVDAGIVYVTDVRAAGGQVRGIRIPGSVNATTSYPIDWLRGSDNAATAAAVMDLVLSPQGQRVLARAGFEKP